MITLDRDYLALKPHLEAECARRKLDFAFEELNPSGFGDLMFVGWNGIHNVEIKQAGELLSDIDHLINQIRNQSAVSDNLWLFVYGEMESADGGLSTYSLRPITSIARKNGSGIEYEFQRTYKRRHHRVNYAGMRKILWRFREVGVQVIEVRDLQELAFELCLLYESAQEEGSTFTRLIVEKIRISEQNPERAAFMKTLMGIQGAGIGEEVADAIADWFTEQQLLPWSIRKLIEYLYQCGQQGVEDKFTTLAAQPLRSSLREGGRKRTIGAKAVEKLKTALGC